MNDELRRLIAFDDWCAKKTLQHQNVGEVTLAQILIVAAIGAAAGLLTVLAFVR